MNVPKQIVQDRMFVASFHLPKDKVYILTYCCLVSIISGNAYMVIDADRDLEDDDSFVAVIDSDGDVESLSKKAIDSDDVDSPVNAYRKADVSEQAEFLKKLKLTKTTKIEDIDENKIKQINSYLIYKLLEIGCEKNILDTVIRTRYYSDDLGCELERFADILDSCGKGSQKSIEI